MNDAEWGCFFLSDWSVLNPVGFKLLGELHVQYVVGLGVGGIPVVWEARQEIGLYNRSPCLRN